MSAGEKRDLARGWEHADALRREEADRLAEVSDEEFDRAMQAMPEPGHVPAAEEVMERARAAGAGSRAPRRRWTPWVTAAALAVLALFATLERHAIVAWFTGKEEPIQPDRWTPPREPTPQERADALRDDAAQECGAQRWALCEKKLDEARALDPAGEDVPRTQGLRALIRQWTTPPEGGPKEK